MPARNTYQPLDQADRHTQEDNTSESGLHSISEGEVVPQDVGVELEQRALLGGQQGAGEDASETEDAFQDAISYISPVAESHPFNSAQPALSDPKQPLPAESAVTAEDVRRPVEDGRIAAPSSDGLHSAAVASLGGRAQPSADAVMRADSTADGGEANDKCLPVDSFDGGAEAFHSSSSLQHIVTQPGSLAAADVAVVPLGVQLQTPLPADSTGAIAHMSPVIPSPFSEAEPPFWEQNTAAHAMQRLPTAPQLPPPDLAGVANIAAPELDARTGILPAGIQPASQHLPALDGRTMMWPDPLYVPDEGFALALQPAALPASLSPMQLPAPFAAHSLSPAALLRDPDVRQNGDIGRLTPSPKKARVMWPAAGALPSPGRPGTAAAPDRHAYADTDGDWLSEPESSADSASSRLPKRQRQVQMTSGLHAQLRAVVGSRGCLDRESYLPAFCMPTVDLETSAWQERPLALKLDVLSGPSYERTYVTDANATEVCEHHGPRTPNDAVLTIVETGTICAI